MALGNLQIPIRRYQSPTWAARPILNDSQRALQTEEKIQGYKKFKISNQIFRRSKNVLNLQATSLERKPLKWNET
jgi:hypothetical protein